MRIVSSLPSTHLMSRQTIENQIPWDVSPVWIRAKFFKQVCLSLSGFRTGFMLPLIRDFECLTKCS